MGIFLLHVVGTILGQLRGRDGLRQTELRDQSPKNFTFDLQPDKNLLLIYFILRL